MIAALALIEMVTGWLTMLDRIGLYEALVSGFVVALGILAVVRLAERER